MSLSYVNQGTTGLPLACPDPPLLSDQLPCDDELWNQGDSLLAGALPPTSNGTANGSAKSSRFANLCRATHILGRVIRHREQRGVVEATFQMSESIQLHQELRELETAIDQAQQQQQQVPYDMSINARALVYSARIIVYDMYAYGESGGGDDDGQETARRLLAQNGLKTIIPSVFVLALELQRRIAKTGVESISPLVIHCLFQAVKQFAWYVQEAGDPSRQCAIDTMMDVLRKLNKRWRVCGKHISGPRMG